MDNGEKNAPKVLTTDDIRKSARSWTLAGDVGLLAHLEQFSENILNKTQETQKSFNELVDQYEELYTKVGNITNQFLALQNCQFVENRVYDEETPTEEKEEVKVQNNTEREKLLLMQYKEAVEIGVKLLDTHFQEIQLPPSSDSDEDDEVSAGKSVIWKPNNPYVGKKFPLLIGSAEWWADDHVGLRASEEVLDSDRIASESENDVESLKSIEKTTKSSSSSSMENLKSVPSRPAFSESSEDLFGFDKNENIKNNATDSFSKGSSSLLEESPSFFPEFEKESETGPKKCRDSFSENPSSEEVYERASQNETTTSKPKVDNAFTRELVAKLVCVTNKNEESVKGKVNQQAQESSPAEKGKTDGNLFDETDDSCDLFSAKINSIQEKPAGSKGLFFDTENDDELFKGKSDLFSESNLFQSDISKKPKDQLFVKNLMETTQETENLEKNTRFKPKRNLVNDLFDDLDDDETLFAVKPVSPKPDGKSLLEKSGSPKKEKPASTFGSDWDEGLFDSINTEVNNDFFGSSGLFDVKVNKVPEPELESKLKNKNIKSEMFSKDLEIQKSEEKIETKTKKAAGSSINKMALGKDSFDDPYGFSISRESNDLKFSILDSEDEGDLFYESFKEEKKPIVKRLALPDDDDDDNDDDDDDDTSLFAEKPKPPDSVSVSSSRSSLFDDLNASKSRLALVFEKDKNNKLEDSLFSVVDDSFFPGDAKSEKDLFSTKARDKEKRSLFDDCHEGDDLFGIAKDDDAKEKSVFEKPIRDSIKTTEEDFFKENKPALREVKSFIGNLMDDDLFKTSETPTKLRESKSDVTIQAEDKLFGLNDSDLFSDTSAITKPKPPSSLSLRAREIAPKGKVVGKLNIPDNLKVKFESATKNLTSGGVKPAEEEKETERKKEEVLDVSLQPSVLLKCPSKDRVKIPGRRRPQSRRARQEAIRNSGTWDQQISPSGEAIQPPKESQSSPVASNPLSPSTDEEDFFKVPELDTNFEKEDQSIFKSDLFESSESSKLDDNLLFDGAPVMSPLGPKKSEEPEEKYEDDKKNTTETEKTDSLFGFIKPRTVRIFDDDDLDEINDESLFKTSKQTAEVSALFLSPVKKEEKIKNKKSLFEADLDDEEDDLFKGKSPVTPSKPTIVDKPKKSEEAKDKGISSFVDPLGLMTKND